MSKHIYILAHCPYHDNEIYFGAYTTELAARAAMAAFQPDPQTNWSPTDIIKLPLDQPAANEVQYLRTSS